MQSLIFRTVAPSITCLMIIFSVFITLRGHNDPGGGFIGGLIGASGFAVYAIANGIPAVRHAMYFHPMSISGTGLLLAGLSGLLSMFYGVPFLTGLWTSVELLGVTVDLATVIFFDLGVYFAVLGAMTSIAFALEERKES